MKYFDRKQIILMLFSFFIAVFIWAMVMEQRNPEKEYEIRSIPIHLLEGEKGPQSAGLTILKGQNQTASVRIKGLRSDIGAIDESRITATVDASGIIGAGNYTLPVVVNLNHVGISIVDVRPSSLNLTVDRMISKSIPIEVDVTGEVNGAYVLNRISCDPENVIVTGPKSEIDRILGAKAEIRMNNVSQSYTEKQRVLLLDENQEEIKTQYTTKDTEGVDISVLVYPTKRVPVEVSLTGQLPDSATMNAVTVEPAVITIFGEADDLGLVSLITTQPVDLSGITETMQIKVTPILPSNIKTLPHELYLTVSVNVTQREERVFSISRYEVENTAVGNVVSYEPGEIAVTLLGTPQEFEILDIEEIVAVIDMQGLSYEPGEVFLHPFSVRLPEGTGVKVIGEYKIEITIGS